MAVLTPQSGFGDFHAVFNKRDEISNIYPQPTRFAIYPLSVVYYTHFFFFFFKEAKNKSKSLYHSSLFRFIDCARYAFSVWFAFNTRGFVCLFVFVFVCFLIFPRQAYLSVNYRTITPQFLFVCLFVCLCFYLFCSEVC